MVLPDTAVVLKKLSIADPKKREAEGHWAAKWIDAVQLRLRRSMAVTEPTLALWSRYAVQNAHTVSTYNEHGKHGKHDKHDKLSRMASLAASMCVCVWLKIASMSKGYVANRRFFVGVGVKRTFWVCFIEA